MLAIAIKDNRNAPVVAPAQQVTATIDLSKTPVHWVKEEQDKTKEDKTPEIDKNKENKIQENKIKEEIKTAPVQASAEDIADKTEDTIVPEKKVEPAVEKKSLPILMAYLPLTTQKPFMPKKVHLSSHWHTATISA